MTDLRNGKPSYQGRQIFHMRLPYYTLLLAIAWTIVIIFAVVWDVYREEKITLALATKEARSHFNKDQAFRLWATGHGGVYVPADAKTQPNPFLSHLKERDIITASGIKLTLMNPAYMLRQMMADYAILYGIKGHITSTTPLNPDNGPDPWERGALAKLENGAGEVFEFTDIDGQPYLRLIKPMITRKGCLKCHGHQGYAHGDLRGGVGVSVPMMPYLVHQSSEVRKSIMSHILIWGVGLLTIYTGFLWFRRQSEEQHRSELALVESEEKYRLATEATLDGVWDWDIQSGTVLYSRAWARILSQETVAPEYNSWVSRIHPEDKPQVMASLEKHLDGGTALWSREHRLKTGQGEWKWVLGRGRVVETSPEGRPLRMVGTMTDISEQKQTEQALKESEERFKTLHNASFGGIAIHDMGRIIDCNQGLSIITGYEGTELVGMDGVLLIAPGWRDIVMDHIRSGREKPYEVMGLRKSGETFPLRLEARNIPFRGKSVRVVEFRDITEEKKAEAEHDRLQEQLIQARKMESVGRLAGGVAHDFNNMLSIIIGNTELALEDIDQNNPVVGNLNEINNAAERSANLTRQLLAFARKQAIDPKVLDVNEVIGEMIKMLKRLIGEGVELSWQPWDTLWPVKIDPSQIDQILANLCINARDAIEDVGTVTIETRNLAIDSDYVLSHPGTRTGEYAVIMVTDNGCGMDSKTVSNLFEPFFTTKEVGCGSGLGLATVYGIVQQNNGFITVSSTPGKGSVFQIFLPRHLREDRAEKVCQPDRTNLTGTETILMVEDETAILAMASKMLSRLGYKVLPAETPGKAMQMAAKAETGEIHLLVTDVVMPEMNGRQLSEELKRSFPGMKCLFMSGYTADIIADHGVLDSGIFFLNKPFTRQELAARVRGVLDNTG